jgi:hypothetical protein
MGTLKRQPQFKSKRSQSKAKSGKNENQRFLAM